MDCLVRRPRQSEQREEGRLKGLYLVWRKCCDGLDSRLEKIAVEKVFREIGNGVQRLRQGRVTCCVAGRYYYF